MKLKLLSIFTVLFCISVLTKAQDTWTVSENTGFTESWNEYIKSLDTFKGSIFANAGASTYGGLYKSTTGTYGTWSNVIAGNVASIPALASTTEGGGYMYASTYSMGIDSTRILRSFDGIAWSNYYTGYTNTFAHIVPFKGLGSVDSMYIVENTMSGAQIIRSAYDSNDPNNLLGSWDTVLKLDSISLYMEVNSTLVHSGRFYIGTSSAELYSTMDGVNWTRNDSVGYGFGDANNYRITALEAFGGYIWAGTENYSGAQLWRTADQLHWTLERTYATGESITDLEATATELWIACKSGNGGGGIIERTDGTTYTLSNDNGFGQTGNHGEEAKLKAFGNNMYYGVRNYGMGLMMSGPGSSTRGGGMSTGGQIWRTCLVTAPVLNLGSDITVCGGTNVVLDAGAGALNYYWNTSATTQTITVSAISGATTTYNCQITAANGCDASDAINVIGNISPSVYFTTPSFGYPYTLCKGDSIAIDANASSGLYIMDPPISKVTHDTIDYTLGYNYDTIAVSGISGSCACTSLISVTIDSLEHTYLGDVVIGLYSPSGNYVDLIQSGYGGGSSAGLVGTEFRMDAANYLSAGVAPYTGTWLPDGFFSNFLGSPNGNWALQVGDTYNVDNGNLLGWTLKFGYADTIMTYSWTPSGGVSSISVLEPVITPPVTANYALTVTNAIGCSTTNTAQLVVPALNITPASPATVCYGASQTLTATGGAFYYWSPATALDTNMGSVVVTTPSANTMYYVNDTVSGCPLLDSIQVNANAQMFASAGPAGGYTICFATNTNLGATASGGTPGYTYNWNDGSTNTSGQNISVSPSTNTSYTLTVTDTNGCTINDFTSVTVIPSTDLHGHVSFSGGAVGSGTVVAYKYIPTYTYFDTVQTTSLSLAGDYVFTGLNADTYLIKVFADTLAYPTLNPTYYGNEWAWDSALVYTHGCSMIDTADIVMIEEVGTGTGPGFLHGTIREGVGFGSGLMVQNGFLRTPGDPIPGLDVKLGKNPGGQMVASGSTGPDGSYSFTGVDLTTGPEYYTVYVDIPGLGRDSSYSLTVTAGDLNHYYLDYIVDSTTIYIVPNAGAGINDPAGAQENASNLTVYPNPSSGNSSIEYELENDANIRLEVFNVLGVKISELVNNDQKAGKYKYNTGNLRLSSGVYFVSLKADSKTTTLRLIITE